MEDRFTAMAIVGCLLGTAVGDALGLPLEGISPRRQRRLFADVESYHLLLGRGMLSDDTEHTWLAANALIASAGREEAFGDHLAFGLRRWLLSLPPGAGLATLRATCRLCLGFGPLRSGVHSAGNGPAMRAAIIGVCYGNDLAELRKLVAISTRITHTDPKAEWAALSVAVAAQQSMHEMCCPGLYYSTLESVVGSEAAEFLRIVKRAVESAERADSTPEFAAQSGLHRGPGGYCLESVPVALHAWMRNPTDIRSAVTETIRCGGDTDTMAAIVGGIVGARVGPMGIPKSWVDGLVDWPLTSKRLAQGENFWQMS
jgi:ADP-ribosyl-[dinitrogen reductase] hydrolase